MKVVVSRDWLGMGGVVRRFSAVEGILTAAIDDLDLEAKGAISDLSSSTLLESQIFSVGRPAAKRNKNTFDWIALLRFLGGS